MTTARLGSQAPKISRKPRTFSGFAMPEINSPQPKTKPHARLAISSMSTSEHVSRKSHDEDRSRHEHGGGRDRAGGKARDAADAVAGRAAAAEAGAEADEKPCRDGHAVARRHLRRGQPVARDGAG